jgi:hypothetical protein
MQKAVTLLEVLIAVVLFSLMVIGFSSIDFFSHFHVMSSDRRVKVQNEVSYILEHMTKEISKAIGDVTDTNNIPVRLLDPIPTGITRTKVVVFIDYTQDGKRDSASDRYIAYWYRDASDPVSERYQMRYCSNCLGPLCNVCLSGWDNGILSNKITRFRPAYTSTGDNNYVEIELTGCWDPQETNFSCGTADNPSVTMQTHIKMPSVSTH